MEPSEPKETNSSIRTLVRSAYDIQKLRIQVGNRIAGNFRMKLGQDPGKELSDAKAKQLVNSVVSDYKRLADAVVAIKKKDLSSFFAKETGFITNLTDFHLAGFYSSLIAQETKTFNALGLILEEYPIYTDFLVQIKGIGPAMAGCIVSEIDITKAKYPSSVYRYCGLDVGPDGKGRSRKKDHLETKTYTDREGEEKEKLGITYNPWIKTKLMGVLAGSFLKAKTPKYSEAYNGYKHRLENHPDHKEKTKLHKHNMAMRYMMKLFLCDLYEAWRAIEGLEVHKPYHEEKLGMVHSA